MSLSSDIRDWLGTQDGPRTTSQIVAGLGSHPLKTGYAIGVMLRAGILTRKDRAYSVVRPVLSKIEAAQCATQGRKRRLDAMRDAGVFERRREATREANKARIAALNAAKPAKAKPRRKPAPPKRTHVPVFVEPLAPTPAAPRAMTAAEWIAQGNAPEVLPIGASAQPLRFVGFAGFTNKIRGSAA